MRPNFFGTGSAAYVGDLSVIGVPLATAGAYEMGKTSLVLQRRTDVSLPLPSSGTVREIAQIVELSMFGPQPITVTIGSLTQQWTVGVTLASSAPGFGYYDLTRTSVAAGTFTAALPAHLVFTFKRNNQIKVQDVGTVSLSTTQGTWTVLSGSATAALAVARLPLGLALTSTSFSSSALNLSVSPAGVNPNRPGPSYVAPSATVDPAVGTLGRFCSIGSGASIAAGAVIGPHATIGTNAQIGANAIIGDWASIGSGVIVGADSVIDSHVVIAANSTIGTSAIVCELSTLGTGCTIGNDAFLAERCVLQDGSSIGTASLIASDVQVGAGASVNANIDIAPGASIPASTAQSLRIVQCILDDGSIELRTMPVSTWSSNAPEAVILERYLLSGPSSSLTIIPSTAFAEVDTPDPQNPPPGKDQLPTDIGSDIARPTPSIGGTGHEYDDVEPWSGKQYKCAWYAEALRAKLSSSYSTTYTCIWKLNPEYHWYTPWRKKWIDGHALTDIHWSDGTVSWLEAQVKGDKAEERGKERVDPDGDGTVHYWDGVDVDEPSDGDLCIEVFDSRAQAEAANVDCPGA